MTREELKTHCIKQVEQCEMWAKFHGEEPHGKVYEEHKLILELLEQEPKTGYWSLCRDDLFEWYECSECHYGRGGEMQDLEDVPRYCPHCGSFMENAYVEVEE